jgi:hypothetical protein
MRLLQGFLPWLGVYALGYLDPWLMLGGMAVLSALIIFGGGRGRNPYSRAEPIDQDAGE